MSTTLLYLHCVEKWSGATYQIVEGDAYQLVKNYHHEMIRFLDDDDVNRVLRRPRFSSWLMRYRFADPDALDNINVKNTHEPRDLLSKLENYSQELSWHIKRLPFYYTFVTPKGLTNSFEALWNGEEWHFFGAWDTCNARRRDDGEKKDFTELDPLPSLNCYMAERKPNAHADFSQAYLRYWNKSALDEVTIERENFLEHFSDLYRELAAFFVMADGEGYRISFYPVRI